MYYITTSKSHMVFVKSHGPRYGKSEIDLFEQRRANVIALNNPVIKSRLEEQTKKEIRRFHQ